MFIEQESTRTLSDCLVLIVDDQESSRTVLATLLEDMTQCAAVESGTDAIVFCKSKQPDLILLDVMMPDVDGHETAKQLQSHPETANIPIIFVTATVDDDGQTKCWQSGCVDYVEKPVNACTLRNRVRSHLSHKLKNDLLEKLIYLDSLTGSYNRHYLDDYLPRLVRDGNRNDTPLSLVLFDIDFFKQYNDHYGHLEGDACLWNVSSTLKETLHRPMDKLVRIGGEEFLVILPNTNAEGAKLVAQKMLNAVYALNIPHAKSNTGRVTISGGVATKQPSDNKTIDHIMLQADKSLYAAKKRGRNCISDNAEQESSVLN